MTKKLCYEEKPKEEREPSTFDLIESAVKAEIGIIRVEDESAGTHSVILTDEGNTLTISEQNLEKIKDQCLRRQYKIPSRNPYRL